ncbi:MAG TPA: L-threonylcarbamoyladenylate synthase [Burkholderiales bacterium]|nr:L-threonylcarbamoyladenylate synthase [Burkholderiales bacterium]
MTPFRPGSVPIREAVAVLKRGGLVAFPTETVYGLGADASNPAAVERIYRVKGRPASHPVIVHIGDAVQLERWARNIPEHARKLAARFWPGPLTLVLKRAPGVGDELTGGEDTIGLRVPGHPVALELLRRFGGGIAAPSANKFGRISPTTAEHVRNDLGDEVDLILDGGPCEIGIESTIIDLSRDRPILLRPGRVSTEGITTTLGATPEPRARSAPRAPGTLESHYAPRHSLTLILSGQWDETLRAASPRRAVLCFHARPVGERCAMWIRASTDPQLYARDLYSNLRALDATGCDEILVEEPPASAEWAAVRDRLARAHARR